MANQTLEVPAKFCGISRLKVLQHLLLPVARKAPARAVVGDLEAELRLDRARLVDLGLQPPAAFGEIRPRLRAPEVQLRDDGEQRDLVHDGVQPRSADRDVDLARLLAGADAHVFLVELEQAEEIDEVRLHEAQAAQVAELVVAEAQAAKLDQLALDSLQFRPQVGALGAALEAILDLRARESGAAPPASW